MTRSIKKNVDAGRLPRLLFMVFLNLLSWGIAPQNRFYTDTSLWNTTITIWHFSIQSHCLLRTPHHKKYRDLPFDVYTSTDYHSTTHIDDTPTMPRTDYYIDDSYWWFILVIHTDDSYWWLILMIHIDDSYCWFILLTHTVDSYWWFMLLNYTDDSNWRLTEKTELVFGPYSDTSVNYLTHSKLNDVSRHVSEVVFYNSNCIVDGTFTTERSTTR